MSKTPAAILSDALTSFNRAAALALSTAQEQARRDLAQAATDVREARRERDEAVSALHAYRLEEQACRQDAAAWKAVANQAELTINHHLETIAQLRQEATQWKNQCLRLEESSRQEAISWKEQFLRVEQERSKLAQRVEELVAEQLLPGGHAQTSITPYTPVPRHIALNDLSASARLQRASVLDSLSPGLLPSKPPPSLSKATSSANKSRQGPTLQLPTPLSENQRNARQRVTQDVALDSQPGSTSNGTRQVVVRRVHAVVEVPVKEESVDCDGVGRDTQISPAPNDVSTSTPTSKFASSSTASKAPTPNVVSTATSTPKSASSSKTSKAPPPTTELHNATLRVKRKASMKRAYVELDDEESERHSASRDSKQSDTEEYQPASNDDDELLMGVETNRKEVYGMKRISKPILVHKTTRPLIVAKKRRVTTPAKKSRPPASSKP